MNGFVAATLTISLWLSVPISTVLLASRWRSRWDTPSRFLHPHLIAGIQLGAALTVGVFSWWAFHNLMATIAASVWAACAAGTSWVDIRTRTAPRELFWVPAIITSVTCVYAVIEALISSETMTTVTTIIAGASPAVIMTVIWLISPSAIGFSDIRFAWVTAMAFCWWISPELLLLAALVAPLLALAAKIVTRSWQERWPYLPFLTAAHAIVIPWGLAVIGH